MTLAALGNYPMIPSPPDNQRVTLFLDRESVEFFKKKAKKQGAPYQRMMREVLKHYAKFHSSHQAA